MQFEANTYNVIPLKSTKSLKDLGGDSIWIVASADFFFLQANTCASDLLKYILESKQAVSLQKTLIQNVISVWG